MATTKLKFYRGLKARYDAASKHLDAIYFATDTKEAVSQMSVLTKAAINLSLPNHQARPNMI